MAVTGVERIAHQDRVIAFRAGGQQRNRAIDQFLDLAHILDRLRRQVQPRTGRRRWYPSSLRKDWYTGSMRDCAPCPCRQPVDHCAIELVSRTDLDLVEAVQHVQLGQRDAA
jgi:hypothetical protein